MKQRKVNAGTVERTNLRNRHAYHPLRKIWHFVGGALLAYSYGRFHLTQWEATLFTGTAFLCFCVIELLRKYSKSWNSKIMKYWAPLMRQHEVGQLSGSFYYLLGCLIAVAVFGIQIAQLSILYLAVGDPIASLVGIYFKNVSSMRLGNKSFIGTIGCALSCWFLTMALFYYNGITPSLVVTPEYYHFVAIAGGIAASLAEVACPEILPLDDNLLIPIVSATTLKWAFATVDIDPAWVTL